MDRDWSRLGAKLAQARRTMGLKQPELAQRISVGRATIQNIEAGKSFKNITPAIRAYAEAVGWTHDSAARVLAGGEPETAQPLADTDAHTGVSDLPPDVAMELRNGRTLGSTVVHLGPKGTDARMVVLLKGGVDMTPEEINEALQEWRRRRRHLQETTPDTGAPTDER
ncbi:helix-turn-helix domain-containing protein [Streptomyces sp. NPDC015220]|uniref:helix-turn-helix domain-containing protein n=1 Tax=Streptomyces sp. NPDC015220 TaxID=3364947 RepID=UPI0036F7BA61